jgi:hypothetical protein
MALVGESLTWCALQRQTLMLWQAQLPGLVWVQVLMRVLKAQVALKKQMGWRVPFELCQVRLRQRRPK